MKNREPYQIIIMRPTGEKPVMTVRSFWAKLIVVFIALMVISLVVIYVNLLNSNSTINEQKQMITLQSKELRDLNMLLTQKDEEIISLKKKLSMTITHKASPIPDVKPMPKLYPPIAEITDISLGDDHLSLKIVNIKAESKEMAKGYFFAVFKKDQDHVSYPLIKLDGGVPSEKIKGHPFTIKNYKPMSIKIPQSIQNWDIVTFYIFDQEEKLRLAMLINKEQVQ
jgi:hypothetical protein